MRALLLVVLAGCATEAELAADGPVGDARTGLSSDAWWFDARTEDPGPADAAAEPADAGEVVGDGASVPRDTDASDGGGAAPPRPDAAPPDPDGADDPDAAAAPPPLEPEPYPEGLPFKGIQPDFHDVADIAGNGAGRVAMNLVWAGWEPERRAPPCPAGRVEYEGRCFQVNARVDAYMREMSARGVGITGILYGSPPWARAARRACPRWAGDASEHFCAPDDFSDFERFAGFVAWYYGGAASPGVARVDDFVVWNEVNHHDWFSLGGWPESPDHEARLQAQADLYWRAHRAVARHRPAARVYVSLTHRFDDADPRHRSGYVVLERVAADANGRPWHVALHPYSRAVGGPDFGDGDRPYVTFGTLGLLTGWLAKRWPAQTPTVLITEVGFSSAAPFEPARQEAALCGAYRNALATPGLTGFIYHRFQDHPFEVQAGIALGLARENGDYKPAWTTWALMDRGDERRCGFEHAPLIRLQRYRNGDGRYWVTPRDPRAQGYQPEGTWWLVHREPRPGTRPIYDCQVPGSEDHFLSHGADCEGQLPTGPAGYVWTEPGEGRAPIHRCLHAGSGRHFASTDPGCEAPGWSHERLLGYGRR